MSVTYGFAERLRKQFEAEIALVDEPLLSGRYRDIQDYARQSGKRQGLLLALDIVDKTIKAMSDTSPNKG